MDTSYRQNPFSMVMMSFKNVSESGFVTLRLLSTTATIRVVFYKIVGLIVEGTHLQMKTCHSQTFHDEI